MKIRIAEKLYVREPTEKVQEWCKNNLILDNPDYHKKKRLGFTVYGTPKEIVLYEIVGDELRIPFGCLRVLWKLHPIAADYESDISPLRRVEYESKINLYPYQQSAVNEALKGRNGVIIMPPGAGKTQTGLEIIARIGGRALWLTHTGDLLTQSKERAEAVLEQGGYGTITAGRVNIGTSITFATVQTMYKLDLSQYKDYWDVIIVDEAHHTASGSPTKVTMFYKVLSSLCARYKIGLTATPKRADPGLERAMYALLGGKLHEVSRAQVAHTTCPIKIKTLYTGWIPDYECVLMGDGTLDYMAITKNMIADTNRFNFVLHEIEKIDSDGGVLVLANRVEYLQRLSREYCGPGNYLSGKSQSKAAREERKAALKALKDGDIRCLFATYQLAAEGLDVPNLKYIVFATPEKNESTVVQAVGRVGRKAEGKEYGTVIDFVDDFGMYEGWYKKRCGYYKKIGAEFL